MNMSAHETTSVIGDFSGAREKFGSAWGNLTSMQLGKGLSDIGSLGGEIMAATVGAMSVTLMAGVLNNNRLNWRQKILPTAMLAVGIPVSAALMVAVIAGSSVLLPPLVCAASAVGIARSVVAHETDRKAMQNINKALTSEAAVIKQIDKSKLASDEKNALKKQVTMPKTIFQELYKLRDTIKTQSGMTTSQKNQLIHEVNNVIGQFHQGNLKSFTLDVSHLDKEAQSRLSIKGNMVSELILEHQAAVRQTENTTTIKKIDKAIKRHHNNYNTIHAMDVPSITKQKMIELAGKRKMSKQDAKDVYFQLATHYLNQDSEDKRIREDRDYIHYLNTQHPELSQKDIDILAAYLETPREIYRTLLQLHDDCPESAQSSFAEHFLKPLDQRPENAYLNIHEKLTDFFENNQSALKEAMPSHLIKVKMLANLNNEYQQHVQKCPLAKNEADELKEHRKYMLTRAIQARGLDLSPPNIQPPKKFLKTGTSAVPEVSDKVKEKAQHLREKLSEPFDKAYSKAERKFKENLLRKKSVSDPSDKSQRSNAKKEFKAQFAPCHKFMKTVEERNHIKKILPQRKLSIGLSMVSTALSAVATFLLPAVATPGAPAAAAGVAVVGALTVTVTGASIANGVSITAQKYRSTQKTHNPKEKVSNNLVPNIMHERSKLQSMKKKQDNPSPLPSFKRFHEAAKSVREKTMGPSNPDNQPKAEASSRKKHKP